LLIRSGAEVDSRNNDGITPLHLAAARGYAGVVELLIKHGASARWS